MRKAAPASSNLNDGYRAIGEAVIILTRSLKQFRLDKIEVCCGPQKLVCAMMLQGCRKSPAHRDNIDHGCPVTGFAGDAPRLGAGAQSHFAGGLDDRITILAVLIAESGSLAGAGARRTLRERAISLFCEMLGALVLSRSVAKAAPALSNEI